MVGRNLTEEEPRLSLPVGETARIKVDGKNISGAELLQTISYLDQLKKQLENEDPTKIDILTHFCKNNGPEEFMRVLEEIERGKNGRNTLLAALRGGWGEFGQLKGRFAESVVAECLNFMFQKDGLRILFPQETKNFLGLLFESFSVQLKRQVNLRDFLLSKEGKELWSFLAKNLPPDLPKRIEVVPKRDFHFFWIVAKGPVPDKQTLKEEDVKILQIPFRVGELDKMTMALLRQYCLEHQIIMEL